MSLPSGPLIFVIIHLRLSRERRLRHHVETTIEPAYRPKPEFGSHQSTVQRANNNVKEIVSPKINIDVEN